MLGSSLTNMDCPVFLNTLIVFMALCSCKIQCFESDDIPYDSNGTHNVIGVELSELIEKVDKERTELQEWWARVAALEAHIIDMREQKAEVLSRKKRNIHDPRLGMFVGKPGLPGRPGTPGVPGAIGRRGLKGLKGLSGAQGLRGPMGPFGPPGWNGPPGFIGAVGIKGERGVAGFDGIPGIIGDVGTVGINGEHGQMGPPGYPGHDGFIGMPGPPGLRGDKGYVGIVGEQGERGWIGIPGPVGLYGEPGAIGEIGFMGPPGEMGQKGLKGERGMSGEIGDWGPVGQPGPIYDPYMGLFNKEAMQQAPGGLENCSDADDENETPDCMTYDGLPVYALSGKSVPILGHPPPGAHVMPMQPVFMKSPVVYGPSKSAYQNDDPQAALDRSEVDYYDDKDDRDILTEDEYSKQMNQEMVDDTIDDSEQGTGGN